MNLPESAYRIAVVGETFASSRTVQRARALEQMGHEVTAIPTTPPGWDYETPPGLTRRLAYRLRLPGDPAKANQGILRAAASGVDIIWIEAAKMIRAAILRRAKMLNPGLRLVWYSEDDTINPLHRSRWLERAIPLFDLWVTTKSFNAEAREMPARGATRVLFVNNSCDPDLHRPVAVDAAQRRRFGAAISFIGSYERPRRDSLLALARAGMAVRVWGNGWADWVDREANLTVENRPVYNDDFARVVAASDINLGFLRKANRDLQTCRSIEIPACAGFMAHQRNDQMSALLRPDREAVYWTSDDELIDLCKNWLNRDDERMAIGRAGRRRVLELALTHQGNISRILSALMEPER